MRAIPGLVHVSNDPRIYNKNKPENINKTDTELFKYLNSGQFEAPDMRLLMKAEEELSQTKNFIRLFPTARTSR